MKRHNKRSIALSVILTMIFMILPVNIINAEKTKSNAYEEIIVKATGGLNQELMKFLNENGRDKDSIVSLKIITEGDARLNANDFKIIRLCYGLENLDLSEANCINDSIPGDALKGKKKIKSIKLPNTIKNVGYSALQDCRGIKSLIIPYGVKSIGNGAFSGCSGITSLTIPDSVNSIGIDAFSMCSGITSLTIPNSVKNISGRAFYGCNKITSLIIPNSVIKIDRGAFGSCGIKSFEYHGSKIYTINLDEYFYLGKSNNLTELDLSNASNITSIKATEFKNLDTLNFQGINNLENVDLSNNAIDFSAGYEKEWLEGISNKLSASNLKVSGQKPKLFIEKDESNVSVEYGSEFTLPKVWKTKNGTKIDSEVVKSWTWINKDYINNELNKVNITYTKPDGSSEDNIDTKISGEHTITYNFSSPYEDNNFSRKVIVGENTSTEDDKNTNPESGNTETISNWQDEGVPANGFAGGSGTKDAPYQIATAEQLAYLAKLVNSGEDTTGKYYKLTGDIDLAAHQWIPIGNDSDNMFKGKFNGDGKKINNVNIGTSSKPENRYEFIGLFGVIGGAEIKNLGVKVNIIASRSRKVTSAWQGGIAGASMNSIISNSYVMGNLSGSVEVVGGLVGGIANSSINNSYVIGEVSGGDVKDNEGVIFIGELVGLNMQDSTVEGYYSSSAIQKVKGVLREPRGVGKGDDSTTKLTSEQMKASRGTEGALVDRLNENREEHPEWKEWDIESEKNGGYPILVDKVPARELTVAVSQGTKIGSIEAVITEATTSKFVINVTEKEVIVPNVGDTVPTGENIVDSYISGKDILKGVSQDRYLQVYDVDVNNKIVKFYQIKLVRDKINFTNWQDEGIPADEFAGGSGTKLDPYQIASAEQLALLAKKVNSGEDTEGKYYKLIGNIDLAAHYWMPIGIDDENKMFKGTFDGNGKKIDNICIGTEANPNTIYKFVGLFGYIVKANIKNIGINVKIVAIGNSKNLNSAEVGGLVGHSSESNIINSYVIGNIVGGELANIGGLVGCNSFNSNISNSYSVVNVVGKYMSKVGGLVGLNEKSTINNSYSAGDVTGEKGPYSENIGGLVGCYVDYNKRIGNCYYNGSAKQIVDGLERSQEEKKGAEFLMGGDTAEKLLQGDMEASLKVRGALVNKLNENKGFNHPEWYEWKQKQNINNGYPTLVPAYTVIYSGNGNTEGSVSIDNNRYKEGASITVLEKLDELEKTGYEFVAWNTKKDGSGTDYAAGASITMGSDNITLHAKWKKEASSECEVTGWIMPKNPTVNERNVTKNVGNEVKNIKIDLKVSDKATWKLYSDVECKNEITNKEVNLNEGANIVYVKVTAEDGVTNKTYTVTIIRTALESVTITKPATKLSYKVGETLDIAGMEVTGTYSDGTTKVETITKDNITGFDSSKAVETQILTITVNGKSANFTISVEEKDEPAVSGPTGNWKDYAATKFAGGSGTENDPYLISTAEELALVAKLVNDDKLPKDKDNYQNAYYKLINNIDLSAHHWTGIGIEDSIRIGDKWTKIGRSFKGNFDGNEKKIDNLYVGTQIKPNYGQKAGLFAKIQDATIKNIRLNVSIFSESIYGGHLGGLVDISNGSQIINCYATGSLTTKNQQIAGGLIGSCNYGNTIIDSCSEVNVTCEDNTPVGGLIAFCSPGNKIINSYATGNITSKKGGPAGGLIGDFSGGTVINSYSTGKVTANLTANSDYKNDIPIGGFIGKLSNSTISNSYSTGNVEAGRKSPVGGFVGQSENSTINNSYEIGSVQGGQDVPLGGLIGTSDNYTIINNGYYKDITAQKGVGQGTDNTIKLTDEQMKALTGENTLVTMLNKNRVGNSEWKPWTIENGKNSEYPVFTNVEPAQKLTVTISQGAVVGSTKATITGTATSKFVVNITDEEVTIPNIGNAVPVGNNLVNLYTSGSDITKGAAENKYLQVYDVNSSGKVVKFYQKKLNSDDIKKASSECDITGWITPLNPTVIEKNVTKTVENEVKNIKIDLKVSDKSTWKLYSDVECKNEIKSKMIDLKEGTNKVYVKVTAEDNTTTKIYTLKIVRAEQLKPQPKPEKVYTITYNGNGKTTGNVPTDSSSYKKGASIKVKGNTGSLVKTGYKFIGWNTKANGSGIDYAVGTSIIIGSKNIILYAKWQKKSSSTGHHSSKNKLNETVDKTNITINKNSRVTKSREITLNIKNPGLESSNVKYMMISNRGDFKGGKWVKYTPNIKWLLDSGDGMKNVFIKFKDSEDNVSEIVNFKVELKTGKESEKKNKDTEKEEKVNKGDALTFTEKSGHKYSEGQWTNEDVEFDFHDKEDSFVGEYLYSLDEGQTWKNSKHGEITEEGIIIVKYKTVDDQGNIVLNEAIVKIDKTPPEGDFTFDF